MMKRLSLALILALIVPVAASRARAQSGDFDRGTYVNTYVLELKPPTFANPDIPVPTYEVEPLTEGPYDAATADWRAKQILVEGVCSTWTSRCYPAHRVQYVEKASSPAYYHPDR